MNIRSAKISYLGNHFKVDNAFISDQQTTPLNYTFFLQHGQQSSYIEKVRQNNVTTERLNEKMYALTLLCNW
jgi:hypothetical protein